MNVYREALRMTLSSHTDLADMTDGEVVSECILMVVGVLTWIGGLVTGLLGGWTWWILILTGIMLVLAGVSIEFRVHVRSLRHVCGEECR